MKPADLPERYYRDHFFELIDFVEKGSAFLLQDPHRAFLRDFRALSDEAQCCYIRMVNRKTEIYHRDEFAKYREIKNPGIALGELEAARFIRPLIPEDRGDLVQDLTKAELAAWLARHDLRMTRSASRETVLNVARENLERLSLETLKDADRMLRQDRVADLDYLLFLYFGRIQKSLTLYTLRDLGIRGTNKRADFRPRFRTAEEAALEYFYRAKAENLPDLKNLQQFHAYLAELGPAPDLPDSILRLRDDILLGLAAYQEALDPALALAIYEEAIRAPARERRVRLLWKLDRREEARTLLERMLETPLADEEILFADDFMARKLDGKRLGHLTESLRSAPELILSDAFRGQPEIGVCEHFVAEGYDARFTENELWCALFGLLFWDELFETEESAIFNPFERSPTDLVGPEFYATHQIGIEAKLAALKNQRLTKLRLLKTVTEHHGELNDLFRWSPDLSHMIMEFIDDSADYDLAHILRTMAKNFAGYHSGFPDLMLKKDRRLQFIEVKAEGDALRSKQLSKMRLLKEAGFEVSLLRVRWEADPAQIYVVVDLETTGGMAAFHRVTEIGAVKIQNGQIVEEFQTLINPGRPIPPFITQLTGITNQMVEDAPTFAEIAEDFLKFCQKSIFVAHNARFDYGFLQREYQRLETSFVRPVMCTKAGMKKAFPGLPSYGLKNLTAHFNIPLESHHRALCDAKAAAALLLLMNAKRAPASKDQASGEKNPASLEY